MEDYQQWLPPEKNVVVSSEKITEVGGILEAVDFLSANPEGYAEEAAYGGGDLSHRATNKKVGLYTVYDIWEDNRKIGYSLEPIAAIRYLKSTRQETLVA